MGASNRPDKGTEAESDSQDQAEPKAAKPKKGGGAAATAEQLIENKATQQIAEHAGQMLDDGHPTTATQSARVIGEIVARKPEVVAPLVDRFVSGITSGNRRVVQTSAEALPAIAKVAPARVAKHLEKLKPAFSNASDVGKDGLVRTFAALCAASVAYQRRLEPVLKQALGEAGSKILVEWTKAVLPALKGEPHANARAVVESRLADIQRAHAQQIADFLGIKLRVRTR